MKEESKQHPVGENMLLGRESLLTFASVCLVLLPLWPQLSHIESAFLGRSLALLLGFLALAMCGASGLQGFLHRPLTLPVLFWALTAILFTLFARYPQGAKGDLIVVLMTLFVFIFVSLANPGRSEQRKLYIGFAAGAGILSLWAILVQLGGHEEALAALQQRTDMDPAIALELKKALLADRALARFGNPNHLGAYLVVALWPAWHLLRTSSAARERILWILVLASMLICIIWTKSRTAVGVAAAIVAAIAYVDLRPHWRRLPPLVQRALWGLAAVILIPLTAAVMLNAPELLGGRLLESGTILARLRYYRAATILAGETFPGGVGLEGYSTNVTTVMRPGDPEANEAHNLLLDAAVEMGVVGVAATFWLWAAVWLAVRRNKRERAAAAGMLAAYLLASLVDFESELGEFAVVFGLGLGILNAREAGPAWREPDWNSRNILVYLGLASVLFGGWWSLVLGPYVSRLYKE